MDKQKAINKIKKCLALASSSEPNEAAAALRQARALMEKFGVSEEEATLSEITEHGIRASGKTSVPEWEANLADTVARSMSCKALFQHGRVTGETHIRRTFDRRGHWRSSRENGQMIFLGAGARPEIAAYAFDALRRQLKSARSVFSKTTSNKKGIEAYSLGWVIAIAQKVAELAPSDEEIKRIDRAIELRHGEIGTVKERSEIPKEERSKHRLDMSRGFYDGKDASLHRGVGEASHGLITHQQEG